MPPVVSVFLMKRRRGSSEHQPSGGWGGPPPGVAPTTASSLLQICVRHLRRDRGRQQVPAGEAFSADTGEMRDLSPLSLQKRIVLKCCSHGFARGVWAGTLKRGKPSDKGVRSPCRRLSFPPSLCGNASQQDTNSTKYKIKH